MKINCPFFLSTRVWSESLGTRRHKWGLWIHRVTRFLLSDSEPPQQARRRRYLLLARCKRREDDHFHIHRSGLGANPGMSLLWNLEPVNLPTVYGHSFRSETGKLGEQVSMETSEKSRIWSKKDNGDIQGNRYCAHGVLKKGAPAARRCASVTQMQYHTPSLLHTVAPPACLFEGVVKNAIHSS